MPSRSAGSAGGREWALGKLVGSRPPQPAGRVRLDSGFCAPRSCSRPRATPHEVNLEAAVPRIHSASRMRAGPQCRIRAAAHVGSAVRTTFKAYSPPQRVAGATYSSQPPKTGWKAGPTKDEPVPQKTSRSHKRRAGPTEDQPVPLKPSRSHTRCWSCKDKPVPKERCQSAGVRAAGCHSCMSGSGSSSRGPKSEAAQFSCTCWGVLPPGMAV